jgi:phosphinothricin acetyltransferase
MSLLIRHVRAEDAEAIAEIYNEAIVTTTATFDLEPKSVADRRAWLQSHDARHPVLVAEVDGRVAGWACLTRWSDRPAYDDTAETSFYVHSTFRGQGIGRRLKAAIIEEARRLGFHSLIARVAEGSMASYHLNQSFGFTYVGTLQEVGLKFGRRLDVHIFQLMLE